MPPQQFEIAGGCRLWLEPGRGDVDNAAEALGDPQMAEKALAALPGKKLVHTNGSAAHAERLLAHLGIAESFSGIVDIASAGYEPKPAPAGYLELLRRHRVLPRTAVMVEDIALNLVPAAALGMTTAWLRGTLDWAAAGADGGHIHYVVDDLGVFLTQAAGREVNEACPSPIRSAAS